MFHSSSVLSTLTIHSLAVCHQLAPVSATDQLIKGSATCYHVYVIMHLKDLSYLSEDGHC